MHTFEAVADSLGSGSAALQQSAESCVGPQSEIKIAKKIYYEVTFGRVFVNVVSLKYIGMIYINVG